LFLIYILKQNYTLKNDLYSSFVKGGKHPGYLLHLSKSLQWCVDHNSEKHKIFWISNSNQLAIL